MTTTVISKTPEAIIRVDDTYKVRYLITEIVEVTYGMPVYTGNLKANGTVAKSQTLKALHTKGQPRTRDIMEVVTKETAKALSERYEYNRQDTANGWILWIKNS